MSVGGMTDSEDRTYLHETDGRAYRMSLGRWRSQVQWRLSEPSNRRLEAQRKFPLAQSNGEASRRSMSPKEEIPCHAKSW